MTFETLHACTTTEDIEKWFLETMPDSFSRVSVWRRHIISSLNGERCLDRISIGIEVVGDASLGEATGMFKNSGIDVNYILPSRKGSYSPRLRAVPSGEKQSVHQFSATLNHELFSAFYVRERLQEDD